MRTPIRGCAGVLLLLAGATLASAQEFRATISGRVTDPGNLAVPGVVVNALNVQTNQVASATTTAEGTFTIPFMQPGAYTVTAEILGFRKHLQEKVEAQVGSTVTLNIQLQIGAISETVTVVAESIDSTKADRGMVIDNARVTELPLNARNPFMLSYLAPGITYNGPAIYQRPFDNGAIADWSINGGQNRNNEFLLDGAPNNALQGGTTSPMYRPSRRFKSSRSSPTAMTRSTAARPAALSMCRSNREPTRCMAPSMSSRAEKPSTRTNTCSKPPAVKSPITN